VAARVKSLPGKRSFFPVAKRGERIFDLRQCHLERMDDGARSLSVSSPDRDPRFLIWMRRELAVILVKLSRKAKRSPSRCSDPRGVMPANLPTVLPTSVGLALSEGLLLMDQQWRGSFLLNAALVGPEMRGSSPVRIARDRDSRQAIGIAGLYPVGEGAGYAGGIVSAAVDGLRTAKEVVRRFAPWKNWPASSPGLLHSERWAARVGRFLTRSVLSPRVTIGKWKAIGNRDVRPPDEFPCQHDHRLC
jgi:hypothetical protein